LDEAAQIRPENVEQEIQRFGFLGCISKLSLSAYQDKRLVSEIAAVASKRNRLFTEEDRTVLSALGRSKFFEVQTILCEVIPFLQTAPSELIELVQFLVETGGADLAANQPNAAFRKWCEVDPRRSDDVIQLAKDGDELARLHLVFALQAKADFDEAIACLDRSDEEQTAGVLALSRMQLNKDQVLAALEQTIALAMTADIKTSCGITKAIYDIAAKDKDVDRSLFLPVLDKLLASIDEHVVHLAAWLLNWHQVEMSEDEIGKCLRQLASVKPENKGTIDQIDMALSKLVDRNEIQSGSSAARAIIDVSKGAIGSDALDSFFHKLTHGNSEQLAWLTTDWLSSGRFFSCAALNRAISEINQTAPVVAVDEIPLPETANEQIFLCRKAIGYLFIHPMTAAAFSVAVLERGRPEAKQHAIDLLYDPLLLSYSGALKDWLEAFAKDNETSRADIEKVLQRAQMVWDGCREAREIVEFEPSESARAVVNFQKMEEAERTRDEAGGRSIFADLFTTQHLLYGDRSAFNIMKSAEELEQKTMPFSEISIRSELPKGIFVDPVGLDMLLHQFRNERMVEQ